jgi:hypothetical protein
MTSDPHPRVDEARIAPVCLAERERQSVLGRRHQNEVNMVGHEAIGPHRDAGLGGAFGKQVAIQRIVAVLEEDLLPPIATLRDMAGMVGHDNAGETGHARA